MRPETLLSCVLLSVLAAQASRAGAEPVETTAEVRVSFMGSSTLHDFGGTAPAVTTSLVRAADGTWSTEVTVPVAGLDTDNDARDAKMRDMLHAESHPVIRATFEAIDPDRVRTSGELPFTLVIGDVSRPTVARVADWAAAPDGKGLTFTATFEVSLAAFDLEAPTALLVVRVADTVRVRAAVAVRGDGATRSDDR